MVMSTKDSLEHSIEMLVRDMSIDVDVFFRQPYRATLLERVTETASEVARVEVWDYRDAMLVLDSGEKCDLLVIGVPADSQVFSPRIVSGRELLPGDEHAILLNQRIAADEGISVGEEVALTVGGQDSSWTVVGLVFNINYGQRTSFVPIDTLAYNLGTPGRGTVAKIVSEGHDPESQRALVGTLSSLYTEQHIEVEEIETSGDVVRRNRSMNTMVISLLLAMSILTAMVGSLSLTSTMSINVVERCREIGVMRSIGAGSVGVAKIVVVEGVFLGVLSWLLALLLSYPGAVVLTRLIGLALFSGRLDFSYSLVGVALWLGIVAVMSALASLWPALRATKISVREALAYE